jgi:uncharacterized protein (TIGR02145 family)
MRKNLFFSIWMLLSLCTAAVSFSSCEKEDEKNGTNTENTNGGNTNGENGNGGNSNGENGNGGNSTADAVLINGVRWATCNVDQPGTFAASPETPGMFYQWNRKKAWPATGSVTGWDNSYPTGDSWEAANDPSPAGYRVPTLDEIKKLLDETNVSNEWTTVNNVKGRKFTDKNNGNSIFLPAVGYRYSSYGTLDYDGASGYYWRSAVLERDERYASNLYFDSYVADWAVNYRSCGFSVRPVAE